jgi:hypothetical protein
LEPTATRLTSPDASFQIDALGQLEHAFLQHRYVARPEHRFDILGSADHRFDRIIASFVLHDLRQRPPKQRNEQRWMVLCQLVEIAGHPLGVLAQ